MARPVTRLTKQSLLLLTLGCCVLLLGCESQNTPPAETTQNTPKAMFARFQADLLRRSQEASGTLLAEGENGLGTTSVRTVIDPPSCVWHAPSTPDGKYTAEVTFVTRVFYSSSTPLATPADEPSRLRAPGQKKPLSTEDEADQQTEPNADSPLRKLGRREEFRDTYDLVYRDDRWHLISREMPESMQLLLNRALEAQ